MDLTSTGAPDTASHRKQRAQQIREWWVDTFRESFDFEVRPSDFLTLEETTEVRFAYIDHLKRPIYRSVQCWYLNAYDELLATLKKLGEKHKNRQALVFNPQDANVGAIRIPISTALNHADAIIRVLGEDFSLVTPCLVHGLHMGTTSLVHPSTPIHGNSPASQIKHEGSHLYVEEGVYELVSWGFFTLK